MGKSNIEWTGDTWNLIRGCSRESSGCNNCYAEVTAYRLEHYLKVPKYSGLTVMRSGRPGWTGKVVFDAEKLLEPLRRKKPTTYFVNSMSDLFHERLTNEEIAAVFAVMAACPQHTFQVLTKRSSRMVVWFASWLANAARCAVSVGSAPCEREAVLRTLYDILPLAEAEKKATLDEAWARMRDLQSGEDHRLLWPLPNVHLGVSVESQDTADERIPDLLCAPAAVRWISAEPLLEAVDFTRVTGTDGDLNALSAVPYTKTNGPWGCVTHSDVAGLDWVVVGGESGPRSRPFDLAWARSIVEQCKENDVPVFVKQLGAVPVENLQITGKTRTHKGRRQYETKANTVKLKSRKGADMDEWSEELRVREMPRPKP